MNSCARIIFHKSRTNSVFPESFQKNPYGIRTTHGDEELGVPGAQIDLLIDRRDRVINVCEIKFSLNEYVIDKEYDMILRNKLEAFRRMTNCKKSLQTTMITTYGVKRGKYSGIIHSQITLDDLF